MDTESLVTGSFGVLAVAVDEVTAVTGLIVGDSVEMTASTSILLFGDGAGEGLLVTCTVGAPVVDAATSDGSLEMMATDGATDGPSDDSMDGKADGVNVGWIVGVTVGRSVGLPVGVVVLVTGSISAIGSSSFFSSRFSVFSWRICVPFNVAAAIVAFAASSSERRRDLAMVVY
jgi:hypothetical protein